MEFEKTLVLIKPEGIQLNKTGEIIAKFEHAGLKIIGMKMIQADETTVKKHYPEENAKTIGEKTKKSFEENGKPFDLNPEEAGMKVIRGLQTHIRECPIIAIVLEGPHAIQHVRNMVGFTSPHRANPGTIRGDMTNDSFELGDFLNRPVRNFVHASDSLENANKEIALWFKENELYEWESPVQKVLYKY